MPRSVQPRVAFSTRLFLRLLQRFGTHAFRHCSLQLVLPTGEELVFGRLREASSGGEASGASPHAVMWVRDCACIGRIINRHDIGLGGAWGGAT